MYDDVGGADEADGDTAHRFDRGFSLIELLVVIVVLGIVATVVVFSVTGVIDRGDESVEQADARQLHAAMEAYQARHGAYPTEADLVTAGLLRGESRLHDIVIAPDGASYSLTVVAP